jgi:hypothetical protein
LNVFLTMGWH